MKILARYANIQAETVMASGRKEEKLSVVSIAVVGEALSADHCAGEVVYEEKSRRPTLAPVELLTISHVI